MKRTLFLISLLFGANMLCMGSAQAIDWQKVKKYSIMAIKVAGCVAVAAAIVYKWKQVGATYCDPAALYE